jgi:copper chaperone
MQTYAFKTTINCGNCVAKVTPFLNELEGLETWRVDTAHPDKILTVQGDEDVTPEEIRQAVGRAGFTAEVVLR